jgi:hypothetical protein
VVGVGLLVAVVVVPEVVLIPLHIRRSRRLADQARARRAGAG